MRRFLVVLLAMLPGMALGQSLPSPSYNGTNITVLPPGATTAQTLPNLLGDVVDVRAYGAKCDNSTNDTAALNLATAAFRTMLNAGKGAVLKFPAQGQCVVSTTNGVNFTRLSSYRGMILGDGASIICKTSGTICVDATGTDHITWRGLNIEGSSTNPPSIGLQLARQTPATVDCGEMTLDSIRTIGQFTFTSVLVVACESTSWNKPHFENTYTGANAYALVMDGTNHFNSQSSYATITNGVDTASSFNEEVFISPVFVRNSGGITSGASIWMAASNRHRYVGGYALTVGPTQAAEIYTDSAGSHNQLDLDVHWEGATIQSVLKFIGGSATPTIYGLTFRDHQTQASSSIFSLGSGVSGVTITNLRFDMEQLTGSPKPIFDTPSAYTVSGYVNVSTSGYWSFPAAFSGMLCVASSCFANPVAGPADAVPTAPKVALSCARRLLATYGGSLCTFRRSSDSATLSVAANSDGDLPVAQVTSWAGGSTIYVTKVFDQTSNGCHVEQANTAYQPTLTLVDAGGRPAITFGDASNKSLQQPACNAVSGLFDTGGYISAVAASAGTPTVQGGLFYAGGTNWSTLNGNNIAFNQGTTSATGSWRVPFTAAQHVLDFSYSEATLTTAPVIRVDGTAGTIVVQQAPTGTGLLGPSSVALGNTGTSGQLFGWGGNISEIIFWKITPTTPQAAAVRTSQGTYYGVVVP